MVDKKIVNEVIQYPVSEGNKGPNTNNHADLVIAIQRPSQASNQHLEKSIRFKKRSECEEKVGYEFVVQEAR
jgi:hypothetical protein